MSILIDTDLLSLLERKRVPVRLTAWLEKNDRPLFVSAVSFAELQYGVEGAPESHRPALAVWLNDTRRQFAEATEPLSEPVLVRWKRLMADLKSARRTMTCEDSLIAATALFHGHAIATHNRRHFEPSGVEIIDPLA